MGSHCTGSDRSVTLLYVSLHCLFFQCPIQGRPQDLAGGGARNVFFQNWKFACREATCCSLCALLGGFGGMILREIFLNGAIWCVLVYIWIRFCL